MVTADAAQRTVKKFFYERCGGSKNIVAHFLWLSVVTAFAARNTVKSVFHEGDDSRFTVVAGV